MKALRITAAHQIEMTDAPDDLQGLKDLIAQGGDIDIVELRDGAAIITDTQAEQMHRKHNAVASLIARRQLYGDALLAGAGFTDVPGEYLVWLEAAE